MTEGLYRYVVKLPDSFYFQGQVFIFCQCLLQFWEALGLYVLQGLFYCLSKSTVSGLLKYTVLSLMIAMSQYEIMLTDSSTGSGLYLQYTGVFPSSS
jgi:hypothetical protein